MPRRTATLQVPALPASLEAVRRFVEQQASEAGLNERAVNQVRMAVDEACANVVEHAYEGEGGHHLDVRVETHGDEVVVRILHTGRSFDPSGYKGPAKLEEAIRQRRSGGFGVFLMQRLMDEVQYLTRGPVSEVRLTKRRVAA